MLREKKDKDETTVDTTPGTAADSTTGHDRIGTEDLLGAGNPTETDRSTTDQTVTGEGYAQHDTTVDAAGTGATADTRTEPADTVDPADVSDPTETTRDAYGSAGATTDRATTAGATTDSATDATTGSASRAPRQDNAEEGSALFADDDSERFRGRWHDVQSGFVDDPKQAVQDADALVAELMQTLASTFADRKHSLEGQWQQGGEAETEDLRLALRGYRSFFDQMLPH
jgi:hypothetical protein